MGYIVQNDLFKYVFACFFANPADDMLKASVCHLMDFIGSENLKVLVKYIAKQYGERLRACTYCKETFMQILRKYEKNEDFEHNKDQFAKDGAGVQMSDDQLRYMENKREESYFDEDDDEVPPHAAAALGAVAGPSAGPRSSLADYTDENPLKRR